MESVKSAALPILLCQTCKGVGTVGIRTCSECRGLCMGYMRGDTFYYFGLPISRYHISIRRARRLLDRLRMVAASIFSLGFFGLFAWNVYKQDAFQDLFTSRFWLVGPNMTAVLFWFGVVSLFYFLYRVSAGQSTEEIQKKQVAYEAKGEVEPTFPTTWPDVQKLARKKRVDISHSLSPESLLILENAYYIGDTHGASAIHAEHVFAALIETNKVKMIFVRLGVSLNKLAAKVSQLVGTKTTKRLETMPLLADDVTAILFLSHALAQENGVLAVEMSDILATTVNGSESIQTVLYDMAVDDQKLRHVISWVRVRERLHRQYQKLRKASVHHNKYGLDRAMTAVATPYLNSFSTDLTMRAASGQLTTCVAREKEMDEMFRMILGGRQSILLVGDAGVGKMTMVEGLAEAMVEGTVPQRLYDRRLVQLSSSSLLAGTTVSGAQERLIRMVREMKRAGNIILFINNVHDLMTVRNAEGKGMDVSETLAEYLSGKNMFLIATTTRDGYNRTILNSEIGTVFSPIHVKEMDVDQAIEVLESKAGGIEYKQQVFFSYDALSSAVHLAARFLRDQCLPESAVSLMTEAASFVHSKRGANQLVQGEDVAQIVSEKTGIPTSSISENESKKLLRLEEEMHERVVGQDEAVSLVANALRRARAEIRSETKPIANFLFLGPTGVGKTELAKTIADVYFGGEEHMIRLDMSEFQDASSLYRLIGEPGKQGTGLLTEQVRQHPFSLVLLDELEKADRNVLNVFLQVFDDGRLTDSVGRVIDFTNTIIIATSNAGTEYVSSQMAAGTPVEEIRQHLIRAELKEYYRPEFLNRFDAIVLFKSLSYHDILQIADHLLRRVGRDLEKRGVELRVEPAALDALAKVGFDPEFGARPMRREIQDRVENALAELILSNKLHRRDVVVIGEGAQIRVESGQ